MRIQKTINKVVIDPEAEFDYAEDLNLGILNKREIKALVEDYMDILQTEGRRMDRYHRLKYLDEKADTTLMLFILKGRQFGTMQMWHVVGICKATDWTEDLERCGQIKAWYNTKITSGCEPKHDWAKEIGRSAITAHTYSLVGLDKEVANGILHGGNKVLFEELPSHKNANRKWYCKSNARR